MMFERYSFVATKGRFALNTLSREIRMGGQW